MRELSLNVLDIAQNSIAAAASVIHIEVELTPDTLVIRVADNGRGMTPEQAKQVQDPFYTTRTTRKVGMGIPLFKMAAEMTGGTLTLQSRVGQGTCVTAVFCAGHIDMMPLGDMTGSMTALIQLNPTVDFVYTVTALPDGASFKLDTREVREQLGEVPLDDFAVVEWLDAYLREGTDPIYQSMNITRKDC